MTPLNYLLYFSTLILASITLYGIKDACFLSPVNICITLQSCSGEMVRNGEKQCSKKEEKRQVFSLVGGSISDLHMSRCTTDM